MRCSPPLRLALLTATLSLAGCATAVSSACPVPVKYDRKTLDHAASEIEALPSTSVLPGMMADYAGLRAEARACAAVTK